MITSDGIRLQVVDEGGGLPILLVHGMWCDHRAFEGLVTALDGSFRAIRLDLRGHGSSEAPYRPWGVAEAARDLHKALDALTIDQAVVVGHSLGGMAALQLALDAPDRLRALVLVSTSAEHETAERQSQLRSLAMTIRFSGARRWMLKLAAEAFFSETFRQQDPGKVAEWRRTVRSMKKRALVQALQAVSRRPSFLDRLGTLRIPALVVCGTKDAIADPAHAKAVAERMPKGRAVLAPGAGHALPYEKPGELASAITGFLADQGVPRRTAKRFPSRQ